MIIADTAGAVHSWDTSCTTAAPSTQPPRFWAVCLWHLSPGHCWDETLIFRRIGIKQ